MMKMKFNHTTLFGALTLLFASCSQPAETPKAESIDMDKLKVEIQAMEDAYAAAEKAKDADGVVAYYSDDANSYGRNNEPTMGKAAIRDSTKARMEKDTTNSVNVYKVVDLFAAGNMAVEIGSWTELNAAGDATSKGYYMSYFEKRDGKYLCVRDMNVTTKSKKDDN